MQLVRLCYLRNILPLSDFGLSLGRPTPLSVVERFDFEPIVGNDGGVDSGVFDIARGDVVTVAVAIVFDIDLGDANAVDGLAKSLLLLLLFVVIVVVVVAVNVDVVVVGAEGSMSSISK
jgi:hypothetical protein